MPNVPYIDRVDMLTCEERLGVIHAMTRRALVNILVPPADYSALWSALSTAGIPDAMTNLPTTGNQNLVLIGRTASIKGDDPTWYEVDLRYEHLMGGANQNLFNDPNVGPSNQAGAILFGKGRSSIVQKPTNFFTIDPSIVNPDPDQQIQFLVSHTFPNSLYTIPIVPILGGLVVPPVLVSRGDPKYAGMNLKQTGEVSIPFPQDNFTLEGVVVTPNPWIIKSLFHRKTNLVTWLGRPPGKWMCTEVRWEVLDTVWETTNAVHITIGRRSYKFAFEYQYDSDGWNPTVIFHDQRTGRAPSQMIRPTIADTDPRCDPSVPVNQQTGTLRYGLDAKGHVVPAGYWTVPYFQQIDIDATFTQVMEGNG